MKCGPPLLFLLLIFSRAAEAAPPSFRYRVREADSLGYVLNRWGACPLWGPRGSVKQTIALNPKLRNRKTQLLIAGEIIRLPATRYSHLVSRGPRALVHLPKKVEWQCSDAAPSFLVGAKSQPSSRAPASIASIPRQIPARRSGRGPASELVPESEPQMETETVLVEEDRGSYSRIFFGSTFDYQRLALIDQQSRASASFLSDLNPAAYMRWDMHWDPQVRSYLRVSYQWFYLVQPFNRVLENQGHLMGSLEAYVERVFAMGLSIGAGLGFSQQLEMATRPNDDLYGVKLMVPEVLLASRLRLLDWNRFKFGMGGRAGLSFPINGAGYSVEMGQFYSGELWAQHEVLEGWSLEGSASFSMRVFDSAFNEHEGMSLGFVIGAGRKF